MGPTMSVIIPAFNAAAHIHTPINALTQQEPVPEVIVVDDGSHDGTSTRVRHLVEHTVLSERLKLIITENGGVSAARNVGLASSTREYVLFLDADDWIHPNLCAVVLGAAEAQGLPDVVAWRWSRADPPAGIDTKGITSIQTGRDLLAQVLAGKRDLWTASIAYRREFLEHSGIRFTPGCSSGEDREFIYKALACAARAVFLDVVLSRYMAREGSLSQGTAAHHFDSVTAHRRAATFIRQLGPEFNDQARDIGERVALARYLRHLGRWVLAEPHQSIRSRLRLLDKAQPGLTREMRRLAIKRQRDKRGRKTERLFAMSPYLWSLNWRHRVGMRRSAGNGPRSSSNSEDTVR